MKWEAKEVKLLDMWAVGDETGNLIYTNGIEKEAKLIAAAPNLLHSTRLLLNFIEEMLKDQELPGICTIAKDTIDKATL